MTWQRIPRYVLLLEDLVKHSPPGHIDHDNLVNAAKRMKDVAGILVFYLQNFTATAEINEKKRDAESFTTIVDIYNRLDGEVEV